MKLCDELKSTHGPDGAILLDIRRGRIFRLNPAGSRTVELLRQGHREVEIAAQLSQEFNALSDVVATDLRHFLDELHQEGLLLGRDTDSTAAA